IAAVMLTAQNIEDPVKRQDVLAAITSISEHRSLGYGYGGIGYGAGVRRGLFGQRSFMVQYHEGVITNKTNASCEVFVDGQSIGVLAPTGAGVGSASYRFISLVAETTHNIRAVNRAGEVVFEVDREIDGKRKDSTFFYPQSRDSVKVDWGINIR
ncbi:MAG TPA: hypothetical protein VJB67_02080, partial [Patescibacteria group bacterium]|nr:hypothetical protein [Patescibacteria group bacterium]